MIQSEEPDGSLGKTFNSLPEIRIKLSRKKLAFFFSERSPETFATTKLKMTPFVFDGTKYGVESTTKVPASIFGKPTAVRKLGE